MHNFMYICEFLIQFHFFNQNIYNLSNFITFYIIIAFYAALYIIILVNLIYNINTRGGKKTCRQM